MNEDLVKYARAALYGVIVIIALAVFLNLGGCASYGKLYERICADLREPRRTENNDDQIQRRHDYHH